MAADPKFDWGSLRGARFLERLQNLEPRPDPTWSVSARYWANPTWSLVCLVVLVLTAFHPPEGLPIRLCFFYRVFGVDCPGCGITRGLSNLWRGRLGASMGYHWFAPATYLYLVVQSAYLFCGVAGRSWAIEMLDRYDGWFRRLWIWGIVAFLIYGFSRSIVELLLQVRG